MRGIFWCSYLREEIYSMPSRQQDINMIICHLELLLLVRLAAPGNVCPVPFPQRAREQSAFVLSPEMMKML